MTNLSRILAVLALLCLPLVREAGAATIEDHPEFEHLFADIGTKGTMVVQSVADDKVLVIGRERAEHLFPPSSTFKIPNTLIALQAGAAATMDERFQYSGSPYLVRGKPFLPAACNADITLTVALQQSCIPVYQALAGRIGVAGYQNMLPRLIYGAGEVKESNLTDFWLTGGIRISALQQADFLARMTAGKLPIRQDHVDAVAKALVAGSSEKGELHGKTGYVFTSEPEVGWYVGWVSKDDRVTTFALNLDMTKPEHVAARREIVIKVLQQLGVY